MERLLHAVLWRVFLHSVELDFDPSCSSCRSFFGRSSRFLCDWQPDRFVRLAEKRPAARKKRTRPMDSSSSSSRLSFLEDKFDMLSAMMEQF